MQYGRVLGAAGQPILPATEIDKVMCEKRTVACPSCGGAVYKAGEIGNSLQYLAHFPGIGELDCELRVRRIVLAEAHREKFVVTVPDSQSLNGHLRVFEQVMLDHAPVKNKEEMAATIDLLRSRSNLRKLLEQQRQSLRKVTEILVGAPDYTNALGNDPALLAAIRHVTRYITNGSSMRLLRFVVCYASLVKIAVRQNPAIARQLLPDDESIDDDDIVNVLWYADNEGFKQYYTQSTVKQRKTIIGLMAMMVFNTALQFVDIVSTWKLPAIGGR